MHTQHKLVLLVLVLTLDGQVHTGKIFGGHEAVPHSRPYMVLLERFQSNQKSYCDGFLLNEDFVMTAAHCQASSYIALLGVHSFFEQDKQAIFVEQSFPHKGYNRTEILTNDIMLLKLSTKANFSKNVKPIALAGRGDDMLPQHCLVSGWGNSDKATDKMTSKLMEVNVTLIDKKMCAENHLFCSEGETGPANGDSGGPLVCDGIAYGVVSFTFVPNPTVTHQPIYGFSKISDYEVWINWTMNLHGKFNHKSNKNRY